MKAISIADYNLTDSEVRYLFGDNERDGRIGYESFLIFSKKIEDDDEDRCQIALLLQFRGDIKGAYKMAESIEDIGARHSVLHQLGKTEFERANPWLIID